MLPLTGYLGEPWKKIGMPSRMERSKSCQQTLEEQLAKVHRRIQSLKAKLESLVRDEAITARRVQIYQVAQ